MLLLTFFVIVASSKLNSRSINCADFEMHSSSLYYIGAKIHFHIVKIRTGFANLESKVITRYEECERGTSLVNF